MENVGLLGTVKRQTNADEEKKMAEADIADMQSVMTFPFCEMRQQLV